MKTTIIAVAVAVMLGNLSASAQAARVGDQPTSSCYRSTAKSLGISIEGGMSNPTCNVPSMLQDKIIAQLKELGVDHVRMEFPMRETADIATNPCNPGRVFAAKLRKAGLDVIAVVGMGSIQALPANMSADDPDYIERVSKNVQDIVSALGPLGIRRYQLENELNSALSAALPSMGWRRGQKWGSWEFKGALIKSLNAAAKAGYAKSGAQGAPYLLTNLADMAFDPRGETVAKPTGGLRGILRDAKLLLSSFWNRRANQREAFKVLSPYVDAFGIDFYPNYSIPYHVTKLVSPPSAIDRVGCFLGVRDPGKALQAKMKEYEALAAGKPVGISEMGAPSRRPIWGEDSAGQARFYQETLAAALQSNAPWVTCFRLGDWPFRQVTGSQPASSAKGSGDDSTPVSGFISQTEPHFGLADRDLKIKKGTYRTLEWSRSRRLKLPVPRLVKHHISAFDVVKGIIADYHREARQ